MLPISRTHYFDGLCYKPKSKWPKRIRAILSTALIILSLTYIQEKPAFAQKYVDDYKVPYVEFVQKVNPNLTYKEAREIILSVFKWSEKFKVDPTLVLSIAKVESRFIPHAISPTGAFGLMQVIPSWHRQKIIDARKEVGTPELFAISTSIYLGTRVIKECLINSNGNIEKALNCYSGNTPGYSAKVLGEAKQIKNFKPENNLL